MATQRDDILKKMLQTKPVPRKPKGKQKPRPGKKKPAK